MNKTSLIIIAASITASIRALPSLPSQIPMHWNINGDIDNWMPKESAVWFFPLLIAAMTILFGVLPKIDPNKDKYKHFTHEWNVMQTSLIAFMFYMQLCTFYIARNTGVSMMPLMFAGMGGLFIFLGNYMSKIRQNYFIGIKVPWTLSSEDNWNKTHRLTAWLFVGVGVLMVMQSALQIFNPLVIFGAIMAAAFLPMIYSFALFKKWL